MNQSDASNPYLGVKFDSVNDTAPTAPAANCYNAACSDAQMAAFDVYEWKKTHQGGPARGAVSRSAVMQSRGTAPKARLPGARRRRPTKPLIPW
ncbi:hypothetical protein ACFS07_25125 [Undibacterium arcticum]